ncbi:unnamed protein product, partial [Rotaria magnacalcarata]
NLFDTGVVLIVDTLESCVLVGDINDIVARRELCGLADVSLDVVLAVIGVDNCS